MASIVVLLVALPLCMGIAIASGVPPSLGIITGIIGGLIVGSISGCPLQVSGPGAALAVIIWRIVKEHGIENLGMVVLFAGLLQLLAGSFKFGQWFRAVSPAVINGMMSGIGLLILSSQLIVMFDHEPAGTGLENLVSLAEYTAIVENTNGTNHHMAGLVGIITISVILIWKWLPWKLLTQVPSTLVAVCLATVLSSLLHLNITLVTIPDDLFSEINLMRFRFDDIFISWGLFVDAAVLAFVASAQTLLTATAVDKMHKGVRTKYDKELVAQGVGNTICGFLGSLPVAGIIVRSSVNVNAGAKTRASAILHGLWLMVFILFFPVVLRMIPTACLAAILVYAGYKLLNFSIVKTIRPHGKSEVFIYFVTVFTIFAFDLMFGILAGIILSAAKLLYLFSHLEISEEYPEPGSMVLRLRGSANFLSLPKLAIALEEVPPNIELHVRIDELEFIDHACLDLIMCWEIQHKSTGGSLKIDWGSLGNLAWAKSTERKSTTTLSEETDFQKQIKQ